MPRRRLLDLSIQVRMNALQSREKVKWNIHHVFYLCKSIKCYKGQQCRLLDEEFPEGNRDAH